MSAAVPTPIPLPIWGLNTQLDQDDSPRGYSRSMVNVERRGVAVVKAKGKLKINATPALGGIKAITPDGSTGYISFANAGLGTTWTVSTGSLSMAIWFKTTVARDQGLFLKQPTGASDQKTGFGLYGPWDNAGTPALGFFVGDGTNTIYWTGVNYTSSTLINGSWHRAVMVFDKPNNILRCYVDGAQVTSMSMAGFGTTMDNAGPVTIGQYPDPSTEVFSGTYALPCFWNNRVLTAAEVLQDWNVGKGIDLSDGAAQNLTTSLTWACNLRETSGTTITDWVAKTSGTVTGTVTLNQAGPSGGGVIQGGFDYQTAGGGRFEIIHGAGRFSKLAGGTETELETHMEPTSIIRGAVFMGQLYLVNGTDVVRSTDGITVSLLPDAPLGKLIHLYNDHLFIANTPDDTNGPSKLYNSALRDPTSWSDANVYNLDTNNAEEITALFTLRGYLGVAKNDSISWLRGNFFDALSDSFDAIRMPIETGIGVVAQGTVVKDDTGSLYYLNEGGFFRLSQPGTSPQCISDDISDTVNAINYGAADLFTAVHVQALDEIWWCVAINGSATPNMILRYSMRYPTRSRVGSWWPLKLADIGCIWELFNGTDSQQIRGGDDSGFTYNMNTGYYDGAGTSYESFFTIDNVRHAAGGYGAYDWLITRVDNSGNWNLNFELYPGGIRNSPHVVTTSTTMSDDSDPTFYNRQTVERQIPISGVTANTLGIKVYNSTGGQNYGMHELAALVRPLGIFR